MISWSRYVDMNNSKDREKIAKEIAKTSNSIRKKYALWRLKWRRISYWRDTSNLLSTRWNKLLLKTLLNFPRILLWLKHSFRENEEPKPKRKRPNALYDNLIQVSMPVKCWINVESIENRTIHFERSIWNNTTAWFIVWPRSHYRRNFRGCRWIACNIYSIHASNIRETRKAVCKLWSVGIEKSESGPER